jgi:indole-3-glycerol phosphate synthase
MIFIAEVKTKSPFGFVSPYSWDMLFSVANAYGDWISIHTQREFGGSYEFLTRAHSCTDKPILAKQMSRTDDDIKKAFDFGASMVLVVGGRYYDHPNCLFEPNSLDQLKNYPKDAKIVWNARDLMTGRAKLETIQEARKLWPGWLCQASHIQSPEDIHTGVEAILVGEHLVSLMNAKDGDEEV